MVKIFITLLSIITFFCGCIGPFKKQPEPNPVSKPIFIESPTISSAKCSPELIKLAGIDKKDEGSEIASIGVPAAILPNIGNST